MRTPLSIIQNNLSYMDKTQRVSDCDVSLKKISELIKAISNLSVEVKDNTDEIELAKLETLPFFKSNPTFFDNSFRELKISLDLGAFDKLISYFDLVARDKFSCLSVVVEGLVESGSPILNIVYDSPKFNNQTINKTYSYLSFLVKDTLNIDALNGALYDLNSSYFNMLSEFIINSESLSLTISFKSDNE